MGHVLRGPVGLWMSYQLQRSVVPPVSGVVVEGEQPQEGGTVLRLRRHQQLDSHLHPMGTLDQKEPGLEHCVEPPTAQNMKK